MRLWKSNPFPNVFNPSLSLTKADTRINRGRRSNPFPNVFNPSLSLTKADTRINRGTATSSLLLIVVKSRSLKSSTFLQQPLFLALVNPWNHKQQNTQPSKRIVSWINIAFLRISGLLIHYNLAPSGLVTMGSIITKVTRVEIRLCCVIRWVWFV